MSKKDKRYIQVNHTLYQTETYNDGICIHCNYYAKYSKEPITVGRKPKNKEIIKKGKDENYYLPDVNCDVKFININEGIYE